MYRILKYLGIIISILTISCSNEKPFNTIDFDWSIDPIESISKNLNPDKEYIYWAFLRSNSSFDRAEILNEKGDIAKRRLIDLSFNSKGFFVWGHHSDRIYYIIAITKDEKIIKIQDQDKLIKFLKKIDTMEEALLISYLNDFHLDYCYPEAKSFRKGKNGYELLLTHIEGNRSIMSTDEIKFIQHYVFVNTNGNLTTEVREAYCIGYEECYVINCNQNNLPNRNFR